MWAIFGLVSALFLGIYDTFRKRVLRDSPVIPVLFLASLTAGLLFLPPIILSSAGWIDSGSLLYIPAMSRELHLLVVLKSVILGASWFLAYSALSNLPITIVAPIRSTAPMWTLIGAIYIFGEKFTFLQWIGIITVLGFFYYFALAGRREGISFLQNKWIFAAMGATLIGAVSGLYDKFLFARYDRIAVQAWYMVYISILLFPFFLYYWFIRRKKSGSFHWTPHIHLIGILLVVSDFLYFFALSKTGSLIAVLSIIRRSSVIISFISGAIFFGERNLKRKGLALLGILLGVILLVLGSAQ